VGFKGKLNIGIAGVLLWTSLAGAQSEDARIKVMVLDGVGISQAVLGKAETEAGRIFRNSGVEIRWVNCQKKGERESCHHVLGVDEFLVHIVPDGKTRTDTVFGEAFLGEDGSGKYADVFFNRVQAAAAVPGLNSSQLLGAVTAHELGHLLLGSRAHSASGIMEPVWEQECLRRIWMGSLLFTREQAQLMQRRVDTLVPSVMAVRGPDHSEPGTGR